MTVFFARHGSNIPKLRESLNDFFLVIQLAPESWRYPILCSISLFPMRKDILIFLGVVAFLKSCTSHFWKRNYLLFSFQISSCNSKMETNLKYVCVCEFVYKWTNYLLWWNKKLVLKKKILVLVFKNVSKLKTALILSE